MKTRILCLSREMTWIHWILDKLLKLVLIVFLNEFIDDSSDDNSDVQITLPSKKIVFTFSPEEWKIIVPEETRYKSNDKKRSTLSSRTYYILPKKEWTPLLAEHFWEHTQLPCCLSFRRAKVHPYGNFYIKVVGKCTICDSNFEGIVHERPSTAARYS